MYSVTLLQTQGAFKLHIIIVKRAFFVIYNVLTVILSYTVCSRCNKTTQKQYK